MELVVLVDEDNNEIGMMEKLQAHREGKLHRAFSVFIMNSDGEWLLQQRAMEKYHAGGLWSNAVCSHPRPGESYDDAVRRRMSEEMGFVCQVERQFEFVYKADVGDLIEYEHDTIFVGVYNGKIDPNPDEVMAYRWMGFEDLKQELEAFPKRFTPWFRIICDRYFL